MPTVSNFDSGQGGDTSKLVSHYNPLVDDVVQGLTVYLTQQPDIVGLVGSENGVPFIFQDVNYVVIERSQSASIVVSDAGGWAPPNTYNTMQFPRIRVDIWVDPPRDASGHVTRATDARIKARQIGNVLDNYLHTMSGEFVMWRNVVCVRCTRLAEMVTSQQPDGDHVLVGSTYYGAQVLYQP